MLGRRIPLARGTNTLKQKTPLTARVKGIRKVNARKEAENKEIAAWRKKYLADHPVCAVWWNHTCTRQATMLHEPYTRARSGGSSDAVTSPLNCLPVCWACHTNIHNNVAEATERGFLLHEMPEEPWVRK